jgi:hypothetical protein
MLIFQCDPESGAMLRDWPEEFRLHHIVLALLRSVSGDLGVASR